ncbi:hypothetical protein STSP_09340 [Streptomyces jeddahensis]|uniref:AMP-binding enzyme C-terminal domain-containing protein n=1 Tax=Streptomyces jeddahensis TaxID=1716141 RepID=A0A177HXT9_9ACTN|nr:hypothetical protein STSP_09340 [Streptomyces jeddahensis]
MTVGPHEKGAVGTESARVRRVLPDTPETASGKILPRDVCSRPQDA